MKCNQISLFGTLRQLSWPAVVLVAMATALAGREKSSSPVAAPDPPAGPAEEQTVTVYIWDQYLSPDLMAEFKERTGIEVVPKWYQSSDEMVEGLKPEPGPYDVFLCEDRYIQILAGKRLIKELDHSKLKNFANIDGPYRKPTFAPKNQCTIPYLWGTSLIAYRKDKMKVVNIGWRRVQEAWLARSGQVSNEVSEPADPGVPPQAASLTN
jgi:spermidine/putrescine-binding protein